MILEVGSKLLVVHRRLFENDKSRYFIGKVEHCEDAVARVSGHTWVQDRYNGKFIKKDDVRTKVIALASPGLIIYALPPSVTIQNLSFDFSIDGQLWLHDSDNHFRMDLSEICHSPE